MTPAEKAPDRRTARDPVEALPARVPALFRLFTYYSRRYLGQNFRAVRLDRNGVRPDGISGPLLVVLNHPSWWDPLVCQALTPLFSSPVLTRRHFAPIDAAALPNYGFFQYLGYFGIDPRTYQGAARFLRLGTRLLAESDAALWVTAQGQFTDVRTRPVTLRPGVGHLVRRLSQVTVLPVAIEYVFWTERMPEALVRLGAPLVVSDGRSDSPDGWTRSIAERLTAAQDALAEKACRRDPAGFEVLVSGRVGIGGVYDAWRWLKARLSGRAFRPGHAETP